MNKTTYKLLSLAVSLLSGMLAGAVFKRVWKLAAGQDEAPEAADANRSWREILLAAAAQGAIVAVVRAVLDRGAAVGAHRLTGTWPGDED
jgi:predicted metal-dependent enzyme (double-stranded beta helix superfamily)